MAKQINDNNFESEVLQNEGVVVVDFYADWCMPCKMLAPVIEEIEGELKEAKFVKINVDDSPITANTYRVASIPTIKIFKNGELKDSKVGFNPKEVIKEAIEEVL